ncbi:ABC transporter ATP-binding protein [Frankia sp. CNm7]|uniref:ABC transporter ATP-binding protein n=1 Tax=Frankia nepalensis TaxID=1836974 RepID=A0A937US24_9ACTN|nr:ABC transporter ATP-binding protein [Frankia nepalensis]MBL7498178.1 ABC transporter ATP-binding protein [Frankia nepalensis]MBL7516371.1 ABC transporter ATP-binding protein [Frankia nepalensis]MBL7518290.1 ABC transporter ATP-binding protein [Frankia nepalensis]MBL7628426.1 ABC transporter ATP-binding protein [Frankia nepalensis]
MADTIVCLDRATVRRDGAALLSDVSWTISAGQRWVVLGPNGAGKTTLLLVAAGRLFPTSGAVDLFGSRLGTVDMRELRYRVGLVSPALTETPPADERVLDAVLTAAWSVLGRGHEHYDDIDVARASELLRQFGCAPLSSRRFGTLSEGERKRVAIARALMTDPELLLLDEPASGLDLGAREALLRRLTRFAADPAAPAMVLVSHHVEEIPAGVTHALLLRAGRVVAAGPVEEALAAGPLSDCFGIPLEVTATAGRYTARLAPRPPRPRAVTPA